MVAHGAVPSDCHCAKPPGVIRHKIWDDLKNRLASMRGEDGENYTLCKQLKLLGILRLFIGKKRGIYEK